MVKCSLAPSVAKVLRESQIRCGTAIPARSGQIEERKTILSSNQVYDENSNSLVHILKIYILKLYIFFVEGAQESQTI